MGLFDLCMAGGDGFGFFECVLDSGQPSTLSVALLIGLFLALLSAGYLGLAIYRVLRYRAAPTVDVGFRPAVTILKPLCGGEPELYSCLRSFCDQDYPEFQIVFGVADAADGAVAVVERLISEFPALDLVLTIDPSIRGENLKVSNLVNMARFAKHDVIVVSDSDTRVGRNCLARVVGRSPMREPAPSRACTKRRQCRVSRRASRRCSSTIGSYRRRWSMRACAR